MNLLLLRLVDELLRGKCWLVTFDKTQNGKRKEKICSDKQINWKL